MEEAWVGIAVCDAVAVTVAILEGVDGEREVAWGGGAVAGTIGWDEFGQWVCDAVGYF